MRRGRSFCPCGAKTSVSVRRSGSSISAATGATLPGGVQLPTPPVTFLFPVSPLVKSLTLLNTEGGSNPRLLPVSSKVSPTWEKRGQRSLYLPVSAELSNLLKATLGGGVRRREGERERGMRTKAVAQARGRKWLRERKKSRFDRSGRSGGGQSWISSPSPGEQPPRRRNISR